MAKSELSRTPTEADPKSNGRTRRRLPVALRDDQPGASTAPAPTFDARTARRLMKRQSMMRRKFWQHPLALTGILIIIFWIIVAVFAPLIAPYEPNAHIAARYQTPSTEHWFGTDSLGRDIFSRIVYGSRVSLPYAVILVIVSSMLGSLLGAIAGYFGGWVDEVIMRITDMFFAVPTIILALAVAAAFGPGLRNALFALVLVAWPAYARVVRSFVLSYRSADYVSSSRLLGSSTARTLFVEILPNLAGPVAVLAMLEMGNAVLLLSALSFLGLGAQPPAAEWGRMVADGAAVLHQWQVGTFAGFAILTVVLAFNLIGDTLRDVVDPRIAKQMKAG